MKTIPYECPRCFHVSEIEVSPIIPPFTKGRMEDAIPQEGGDFSPYECPKCKADFAASLIHEIAFP